MPTLTDPDPKPPFLSKLRRVKLPLWAFLLVLVLLSGAAIERHLALLESEERSLAQRQEHTRRMELQTSAMEAAARESEQARLLFGDALAWAIRSALVHDNVREVDQYFAELVKNDRVKLALLVNARGKILASSDRQFRGKSFADHFPRELLKAEQISLHGDGDEKRVVLPIRGLTSRLGTALVVYSGP